MHRSNIVATYLILFAGVTALHDEEDARHVFDDGNMGAKILLAG